MAYDYLHDARTFIAAVLPPQREIRFNKNTSLEYIDAKIRFAFERAVYFQKKLPDGIVEQAFRELGYTIAEKDGVQYVNVDTETAKALAYLRRSFPATIADDKMEFYKAVRMRFIEWQVNQGFAGPERLQVRPRKKL